MQDHLSSEFGITWSEGDQAVGSIVHVLGLIEADGRVNEMFSCSCIHQRDILVPC